MIKHTVDGIDGEGLGDLYHRVATITVKIASEYFDYEVDSDTFLVEEAEATEDEICELVLLWDQEFNIEINLPPERLNDMHHIINYIFKIMVLNL